MWIQLPLSDQHPYHSTSLLSLHISFCFLSLKKKKVFDIFLVEVSIPPEPPMSTPNNFHTTTGPISYSLAEGQSRARQTSNRALTQLQQQPQLRTKCQLYSRAHISLINFINATSHKEPIKTTGSELLRRFLGTYVLSFHR